MVPVKPLGVHSIVLNAKSFSDIVIPWVYKKVINGSERFVTEMTENMSEK